MTEILLYETNSSPYLQVETPNNKNLSLTIFDLTSKEILTETALKTNSLNIENLQCGSRYLLKTTTIEGNSIITKLLKRYC